MTDNANKNGKSNYATWTLLRYFNEVYFPSKVASGRMTRLVSARYRSAIVKLNKLFGRDVKLNRVGPALVEQFAARLTESGFSGHTTRNYVAAVKSVVRHWRPEVLPNEQGIGQAPLSFVDADIKGTLEQIFVDCYLPERTGISSESTVRQYGRCLRLFGIYLGHPAEPCHLTDRCVGKFLRWLVEVEGVKAVTANGYVKQIKALWVWLAKKRIVDRFPTIEKLKEPEPMPVSWSEDELQKLFAACQEQVGYCGPVLANLFWTAFHLVLWDAGERTQAMLSLKWDWLDWKTGCLSVPGEFRKGRIQGMVYHLKPATVAALKAIRRPERELIFDFGLTGVDSSKGKFYSRYQRLVKEAGLPYVPHRSGPQKMRRSFASFIEAAGGNATRALKHRDRRVTEDSYLDPRITEVESENVKLFPLDGKGGAV